jgi:hypothetical protein
VEQVKDHLYNRVEQVKDHLYNRVEQVKDHLYNRGRPSYLYVFKIKENYFLLSGNSYSHVYSSRMYMPRRSVEISLYLQIPRQG